MNNVALRQIEANDDGDGEDSENEFSDSANAIV
jgi:hypothetical protein